MAISRCQRNLLLKKRNLPPPKCNLPKSKPTRRSGRQCIIHIKRLKSSCPMQDFKFSRSDTWLHIYHKPPAFAGAFSLSKKSVFCRIKAARDVFCYERRDALHRRAPLFQNRSAGLFFEFTPAERNQRALPFGNPQTFEMV